MISTLLSFGLMFAHVAPKSPYHWHITCTDFKKRVLALRSDPNLTNYQKYQLLRYLATKVDGPCHGVLS